MSIPTSETHPDGLHRAPRNHPQQVRKVLETAGPRQIKDFINDLIRRNKLNLNFFWQLLLSLALLSVGLVADLPLLVLVAAVTAPVLNPMMGLVLSAIKPSAGYLGKSLFFTLLMIAVFFGGGWLINLISPLAVDPSQVTSFFTIKNGWLEWGVLVLASVVSVYLFLYRPGGPSVVTSTMLAYLIFIPLTIAGLLMAQGDAAGAIDLLVLIGTRFFVSLLALLVTTWVLGFPPKGAVGWLFFAIILLVSTLGIFESRFRPSLLFQPESHSFIVSAAAPTELPAEPTTIRPSPTALPTKTLQPTATKPPIETVFPAPVSKFALVVSESGVVVRESPSTQAAIITYISNGLQVTLLGEKITEQDLEWEKVIAPDGKEGWVAARFLSPVNP